MIRAPGQVPDQERLKRPGVFRVERRRLRGERTPAYNTMKAADQVTGVLLSTKSHKTRTRGPASMG